MSLTLLLVALALLLVSALGALLSFRSDRAALAIGTVGALLACGVGLVGAGMGLADCGCTRGLPEVRLAWGLPAGSLHLGIDALSAFFLGCLFLVCGLAAVHGAGWLRPFAGRRHLAVPVAFFNLAVAGMATVLLSRDGVLFLIAWEVMSLAAFCLVTFEDDRDEVRRAGLTFLIASHLGVAFLYAVFALLNHHAGSFDFDAVRAAGVPQAANAIFLLAVAGFGTKAAFWPVHVWAPDTYPAAPPHVAAIMSGTMSKLGIYGILRVVTFLGPVPEWWGALLIVLALVTGFTGVLHALSESDLRRVVAYSSVENLGIVALGIGLGLLAQSQGHPTIAMLGYAGALAHVLNHGIFKGLLFQGAGAILRGSGTSHLDALGGLRRRMPKTAFAFLIGAVAISGLPPFNGFAGEWLIYLGAFRQSTTLAAHASVFAIAAIAGLSLIGAMAAATFVRAFGIAFLGEPRTPAAAEAQEVGAAMRAPMLGAALLCIVLGLFPQLALFVVARPAAMLANLPLDAALDAGALMPLTVAALVLVALTALLWALRWALLRGREVASEPTWGCGFAAPTARIQYTATSFSQPLLEPFDALLPKHGKVEAPEGFFPTGARVEERMGDFAGERLLVPAARRVLDLLGRVRFLQHGKLHLYLVYVLVTLIALLAWQLAR